MPDRHNSIEAVKSYLLGTIGDRDAEALELKYFSDPQFLEWVKQAETELIGEYLDGVLPAAQKQQFEERYLKLPELHQRYQEVVSSRARQAESASGFHWRYSFGAAFIALVVFSPWIVWKLRSHAPAAVENGPVLTVQLTPGIVKGDAREVEFAAPRRGRVHFSLELAGQKSPVDCFVTLRAVDGGDAAPAVWSSPVIRSANQRIDFEISALILRPSDYLFRAQDAGGAALGTYFFRVLH